MNSCSPPNITTSSVEETQIEFAMLFPLFEMVFTFASNAPYLMCFFIMGLFAIPSKFRVYLLTTPFLLLFMLAAHCAVESQHFARLEGYDLSLPSKRTALEQYIDTGNGNMTDIIEGGRYPPTFGTTELYRYLSTQLSESLFHNTIQDARTLPEAYNKGDDWFEATLGEPMVYTCAIYPSSCETMWSAQHNKLDFISHALDISTGDRVLDIGAGWGRLSAHYASKGANVTGVLMASDQQNYANKLVRKLGLSDHVEIRLQNFFDMQDPKGTFDAISAVEMAEHVGIRNYDTFLQKVHKLLKNEGTFYIQVAGLPRGYAKGYNHYEDIIWGLFMDEHVFPGADASCPMGWVITKLEQAGFEVQNVHNLGSHYSKTLAHWLQMWESKRNEISEMYGEKSWRRWRVFLAWSVRIARKGGSTVQFITATKSGQEKSRIAVQNRLAPGAYKLPSKEKYGPGGGPSIAFTNGL